MAFLRKTALHKNMGLMSASIVLIMTISFHMQAQILDGEYHLTGIPEMAAGFRFTSDGRFEFFHIYGAADRIADGTFTVEGDTLKLSSSKEPGKDFIVSKQSRKGSGYTLRITDDNPILASAVRALYFVDGTQHEVYADNDGTIRISAPSCDKIYLQHGIFPDIATLIKDEENKNNTFELRLHPDIQKVSFKGIDFIIAEDTLTCLPNYFMPMQNIRFVKVN